MNILIAGIISVIMLLVGGAKYYNYRHYNPQDEVDAQEQERLLRHRERLERIRDFLNTFPRCDDDDHPKHYRYHLIRTENELIDLMTICPLEIDHCKIRMSQDLTEERTRQLLREHYKPRHINIIANNFIREPEDTNV